MSSLPTVPTSSPSTDKRLHDRRASDPNTAFASSPSTDKRCHYRVWPLTDAEAAQDVVLTDLVMPALPFGLNRSTTHVARVARKGFAIELLASQRLFRQGLGRGVRRAGMSQRRYWILDGRLVHPPALGLTSAFRAVLTKYLHRAFFKV